MGTYEDTIMCCRDCTTRHIGCHGGKCEKEAKKLKVLAKEKTARKLSADGQAILVESIISYRKFAGLSVNERNWR